jgi:hypothetical protein
VELLLFVLHGHEGGEVSGVVRQQQGGGAAVQALALQGEVNATKGDGGQGVTVSVTQDSVSYDNDGSPQDMGQHEHVALLQTLIHHRVTRTHPAAHTQHSIIDIIHSTLHHSSPPSNTWLVNMNEREKILLKHSLHNLYNQQRLKKYCNIQLFNTVSDDLPPLMSRQSHDKTTLLKMGLLTSILAQLNLPFKRHTEFQIHLCCALKSVASL